MVRMRIDVALNPSEIARLPERDLSRTTCIVFDVLRATSSMVTALAGGELSDSAHAALSIARHFPTPLAALKAARNGRALEGKGRGKEVEWCAQVSLFNVVGIMENAVIRPIED